jgi:hypothetical protein
LLKAYSENHSDNFISINANAAINGYPLQVSDNFKVDWAGNLTCVGIDATNGNFSGTLDGASGTFTGTLSAGIVDSATITGGSIEIGKNFSVDTEGNLYANNGEFTGTITASNISASGDGGAGYSLSSAGVLSATGVDLTGKITATEGKIGPWYIGSLGISSAENGGGVRIATDALHTVGINSTSATWTEIVGVAISFNRSGGTLHTLSGHLSTGSYNSLGLDYFFASQGFYVGAGTNGKKVATEEWVKNNAQSFVSVGVTEARVKQIIESYGYVTKSYVHNYGTVDYGGDPSHKHTFRLP